MTRLFLTDAQADLAVDPGSLPISLFTATSWMTEGAMLEADATVQVFAGIECDARQPDIDLITLLSQYSKLHLEIGKKVTKTTK